MHDSQQLNGACGTDNSLIRVRSNLVTQLRSNKIELWVFCGEPFCRMELLWLENKPPWRGQ